MGTATYFSPEQAQGLAGRRPQRRVLARRRALRDGHAASRRSPATRPCAVAYKHVREEPVPPSQRNPDVPARPRADHHDRAREGSRPPLPDRRRHARRPAALPPRPPARRRARHRDRRRGADDRGRRRAARRAYAADHGRSPRVDGRGPLAAVRAAVRRASAATRRSSRVAHAARARGRRSAASCSPPIEARRRPGDGHRARTWSARTSSAATAILEQQGFVRRSEARRRATTSPIDTVIDQSPKRGRRRQEGQHGHAERQRGRGHEAIVPDITDQLARGRDADARELGLQRAAPTPKPSEHRRPGPRHPHRPRRRASAAKVGSTVHDHRLDRSPQVTIPDVVEPAAPAGAASTLVEAGFSRADRHRAERHGPGGQRDAHRSARGHRRRRDRRTVKMFVSTGSAIRSTVPEVLGLTVADAKATLATQGFTVVDARAPRRRRATSARSLDQTPTERHQVDPNSTVVLTVGVPPHPRRRRPVRPPRPRPAPGRDACARPARALVPRRTAATTCRGARRATAGSCSSSEVMLHQTQVPRVVAVVRRVHGASSRRRPRWPRPPVRAR